MDTVRPTPFALCVVSLTALASLATGRVALAQENPSGEAAYRQRVLQQIVGVQARTPKLYYNVGAGFALPAGMHTFSFEKFVRRFGFSDRRMELLRPFYEILQKARAAGVTDVFVGGSMATSKLAPGDIDAAYFGQGTIDYEKLGAASGIAVRALGIHTKQGNMEVPITFNDAVSTLSRPKGVRWLDFLGHDRKGNSVGRVHIPLSTLPPWMPEMSAGKIERAAQLIGREENRARVEARRTGRLF